MSEQELLEDIFGQKWNGVYRVRWCELCDIASIVCPSCGLGSCSDGGCGECSAAFAEWHTFNLKVEDYLTPEEKGVYQKCLEIRKFIVKTTPTGAAIIDWKALKRNGEMSLNDERMFTKELA